jgi:hypothetical protein
MVCFFWVLVLTPSTLGGHNFLNCNLFLMISNAPYAPIGGVQVWFGHQKQQSPPLASGLLWALKYNKLMGCSTLSLTVILASHFLNLEVIQGHFTGFVETYYKICSAFGGALTRSKSWWGILKSKVPATVQQAYCFSKCPHQLFFKIPMIPSWYLNIFLG